MRACVHQAIFQHQFLLRPCFRGYVQRRGAGLTSQSAGGVDAPQAETEILEMMRTKIGAFMGAFNGRSELGQHSFCTQSEWPRRSRFHPSIIAAVAQLKCAFAPALWENRKIFSLRNAA